MVRGHTPSRSNGGGGATERRGVSLQQLLDSYDLVGTEDGNVLVADKGGGPVAGGVELKETAAQRDPDPEDLKFDSESSAAHISGVSETKYRRAVPTDYNPDFRGQHALNTYREMRNDAVIRNSLRIAKTPILGARWFMVPHTQSDRDLEVKNFVWDNLHNWMTMSFPQFIIEALYMLDYGFYAFEKVFDEQKVPVGPRDGEKEVKRRIIWRKFHPLHPYDVNEFKYDSRGGPEKLNIDTRLGPRDLPIWKALVFTFDKEGGALEGFSVLRSAYKHWFYKEQLYKIDAIQKERHGIGIPVIKLPPNFDDNDKRIAGQIGENLRTNESAHVVLPPGFEVLFLKLEGQKVDALASADHHAHMVYRNVLADFMWPENVAANAVGEFQEQAFMKSSRFVAETFRDIINKYAIPQLCNFNYAGLTGYPELRVRRLGDEGDWRTISFAIRNLVGANVLRNDQPLRNWVRDEMDLPEEDVDTIIAPPEGAGTTPQATGGTPRGPNVGPPRQSPAAEGGGTSAPNGKAGADVGGGG